MKVFIVVIIVLGVPLAISLVASWMWIGTRSTEHEEKMREFEERNKWNI